MAVLCRADETAHEVECYAVHGMAEYWRQHGIDVHWLFGPSRDASPASLLLVHVNLSVVPREYLDFAQGYPRVLNGAIADIRKRTVCGHLVRPGDGWQGAAIVKTNLNFAGRPELHASGPVRRAAGKLRAGLRRLSGAAAPRIRSQDDYLVFDCAADVPREYFSDPSLVVQRFLPEIDNGLYHVRSYSFLGDRATCMRLSSRDPVIHWRNALGIEAVEPHPEIIAERARLGMDYGKLDYVLHEGRAVLIDVNKTLGATRGESNALMLDMRRERARGIFGYLGMPAPRE